MVILNFRDAKVLIISRCPCYLTQKSLDLTYSRPNQSYPTFIWAILADFRIILSTDSRLLSQLFEALNKII